MLPPDRRVRRREEFTLVLRAGRTGRCGPLIMHVGSSATTGPARAGFVVGRAVGRAVDRNRLRRRLRHLVRDRLDRFDPGSLVVVRATPGAAAQSAPELGRELDTLIRRLVPAGAGVG
ncbi:MAG TPA: ribonuclease P protein component [Mycobacteriales bacterium]|nr:ribonuclease P protein component [Mycobacteriales bacterium]